MKIKAFTLIELLIVVAIIAILAAIAVPNFLEAQTRSKVSRTRADMRTVATALEAYAVDHNAYVYVNTNPGYGIPPGPQPAINIQAYGLTTPIAYITALMFDPFGGKAFPTDPYAAFNTTKEYWYWTEAYVEKQSWGGPGAWSRGGPGSEGNCKWALMSKGPDQHWSHQGHQVSVSVEVDKPLAWQYDATNGTISWGNIVRVGP